MANFAATCKVFFCAAALGAALGAAAAARQAEAAPAWRDDFVTRLEALALLQTLNAELLSHDSATATLERWCREHRMAQPAVIVAERLAGAERPPSSDQRRELGVTAQEPVRHRRVRLRCGAVVMSEADNWYVPSRLTATMNHELDQTDHPFGKVVHALRFRRRTLSAQLLWQPLPPGWEMSAPPPAAPAAQLLIPRQILQHRALLSTEQGTPISEVIETYSGEVFNFPALLPHVIDRQGQHALSGSLGDRTVARRPQ